MDTSWTILASCLFLQLHPIRGLPKGQAHQVEDVYASPGKDVDLTCHIQKEIQLVQAQWDVITDREALIAVHHPNLGFYCDGFAKNSCTSSVTFSRTSAGGAEWVLHLRNVSSSLSGKYKCSITTFPTGIWTIIKNLHVQAEEMRGNRTIDAEFNQTLEIPCLDDKSENLLGASILWLTEQNGAREVPLGPDSRIETQLPRDRLGLREDHRLVLSPVQTHDHDRRFTCQATLRSGKVLKSITTLKVWAKPEVFITQQNTSTGLLGGVGAHCWVRNVFPSARVTWYMDGEVLDGRNLKGLITTTEESRSHGGLSVLKSTLELRPALSESRRLWCVALFPGPGGEVRNVSSRRMALSMVEWTSSITSPPADEPEAGLEATDATANWPDSSAPTAGLTLSSARTSGAPLSTAYTSGAMLSTERTSDATLSSAHTAAILLSSKSNTEPDSGQPPGDTNPTPSGSQTASQGNSSSSSNCTSCRSGTTPTGHPSGHGTAGTGHSNTTVAMLKPRPSWPVIVAALLFFFLAVFALGIRKWCQYQQEIMERPPPFKPPPPPIKYTYIQEPGGREHSCHEMENL